MRIHFNNAKVKVSGIEIETKKTFNHIYNNVTCIEEVSAKEIEKECIYLPPFYFAEVGVANKLKKLAAEPAADRLWVSLMKARQDTGNPELSVDVDKLQHTVNMK